MPSSPAYCPRGWFLHLRPRHGCLVSGLPPPFPPRAQPYGLFYTEAFTWGTADMCSSFNTPKNCVSVHLIKLAMVAAPVVKRFWSWHRCPVALVVQLVKKKRFPWDLICSHISSISTASRSPTSFLKPAWTLCTTHLFIPPSLHYWP